VRALYSLAIYLLVPLLLVHLLLRGMRDRDYLKRWGERFAWYKNTPQKHGIVVHAVSVGETNAAAPLIRALINRYPQYPVCVTSFTTTGSARVKSLFPGDIDHARDVDHFYAPLDTPGAVKRFFDHVQPRLLIIMETEIWLNLYLEAGRRNIPLLIANARISDRSLKGYKRMRYLTRAALCHATRIAAQSKTDANRLIEIGAKPDHVEITGNLKFDVNLPDELNLQGQSLRLGWGQNRPVILAGSTHEGDEAPVLEAFKGVLRAYPDALLVLVPRHPERFQDAAQLARDSGLVVHKHSESSNCPKAAQCYLVDVMGELLRFYAASDIAFVGGSLDRIGGHNVLEPAALSLPVLIGPHTFNFEDICNQMLECGAALRVTDTTELEAACVRLLGDETLKNQMGRAGLELVLSGQGALARTLETIDELLDQV
jgi:3-deoxy-D-manno-octulosonic-acid transferase